MTTRGAPEKVRLLRDLTGFGIMDCRRAFSTAEAFGGDVVAALAAIDRNGLAIVVRGDRDAWAASGAPEHAARWRASMPGLDEAFPLPSGPAPAT